MLCGQGGECNRCKNGAYLLDGSCVAKSECQQSGLAAVSGGTPYARACIAIGGHCVFDSDHSCRSPVSVGGKLCLVSRILADGKDSTCTQCASNAWLDDGKCYTKQKCSIHDGSGCGCSSDSNDEQGGLTAVSNCEECTMVNYKKNEKYRPLKSDPNLYMKCRRCAPGTFLTPDGDCVDAIACIRRGGIPRDGSSSSGGGKGKSKCDLQ